MKKNINFTIEEIESKKKEIFKSPKYWLYRNKIKLFNTVENIATLGFFYGVAVTFSLNHMNLIVLANIIKDELDLIDDKNDCHREYNILVKNILSKSFLMIDEENNLYNIEKLLTILLTLEKINK
jgi:hypothetical protein